MATRTVDGQDIRPETCSNGVLERQEIRTLTEDRRKAFINAFKELHTGASPTELDRLSDYHNQAAGYAHSNAMFLPWHRYYLVFLERKLQKQDPMITVPYWDWTLDSQAPETSVVFKEDFFGGNGKGKDNCVEDGPLAGWQMAYPKPGCLKRKFDQGDKIGAFYSPEGIRRLLAENTEFSSFHLALEGIPHGRIHVGIDGHMNTMHAPNDPLFFLHHAMVDKIWSDWQEKYPDKARSYAGKKENGQAAPSDIIPPWNDLKVEDMFDTTALCYKYA
ncbi:hypothetical protein THASP1DRAFT_14104, partial [Thamnocephalis sphaerospora]